MQIEHDLEQHKHFFHPHYQDTHSLPTLAETPSPSVTESLSPPTLPPERTSEQEESTHQAKRDDQIQSISPAPLYTGAQQQGESNPWPLAPWNQQNAERALGELINQLGDLFEAMQESVVVYGLDGSLRYANRAGRELFALNQPSEHWPLHTQTYPSLFSPSEQTGRKLPQEHWPLIRILQGEHISGVEAVSLLIRTSAGRELLVRESGAPLYDRQGQIIGGMLVSRASTEQQRQDEHEGAMSSLFLPQENHLVEEQRHPLPVGSRVALRHHHQLLAESQALNVLQPIIDELPYGICLVRGLDARLVLANRTVREIWGLAWSQGQSFQELLTLQRIHIYRATGSTLPPEHVAIMQELHDKHKPASYQVCLQSADDHARLAIMSTIPLDPTLFGQPDRENSEPTDEPEPWALLLLQDITALKEAEQLKQDITALKEAEQLKDDFIATAAHELRSPLTALVGYAEMLKQQITSSPSNELAEWQIEALEAIAHDSSQLVQLTNDLLDVTQLQAGKLVLQRYPADLVALVRRVATRLQAAARHHLLTVETTSSQIGVSIDFQRIEQVLTNLINNAIKYSPPGSTIRLTVKEHPEAGVAIISIRDQGIGIPAHQHAQVFTRFFRADNACILGIQGTGLGLHLCRKLIELHQGQIWFESVEGQGSTFHISLPLNNRQQG